MTTTPTGGSRAAPEGPDRPVAPRALSRPPQPPPSAPQSTKRRRGPWGWWTRLSRRRKWALVALFTVPVLIVVGAAGIFYVTTKVPLPQSINTAEVSTVTYRDGKTVLFKIGSINRTNVPLSAVSLDAQHAVLAAEDKNFYSESGISWTGIARALWADVRGHEILQGGSTITQQYAKNAYLTSERSFTRKLKEIVIAIKLSHKYSKDQILDYYLNTIYFGRGAYGIEAASQSYFGIPAAKLTAAQGVVLAGLIRAPSVLDPRINPAAAKTRFAEVVQAMAGKKWLTAAQAKALTVPATIALRNTGPNAVKSPQDAYIRDEVMRELEAHGVSEDEINRGGLQITTTLDPTAQAAAVASVNNTFASTPADVQPALVSIQPGTGEVRAWYGGRFYGKGTGGFTDYVDNVTDPIQPGSSFKPIALAAALKQGISLNSYYNGNDHQVITPGYPQGVPNYGGESLGQINLLQATALSVNSVYVSLALDAGEQNVIDMAHALGIPQSETLPSVDALPLGVAATSPLNMTDVYATFAAQGVQAPAHLVAKAVDHNGKVLYQASTKTTRVLTPGQAADETYALRQPFAYGTAAGLSPGRPVAGKTGTTDNNVSAWLCGYAPQLATCVAVSRADHRQSLNGIFNNSTEATGASTAGQTWQAFMTAALAGQPVLPFPDPVFGGSTQAGHAPPAPSPSPTVSPTPSSTPTPTGSPGPSASARPAPSTSSTPSTAPKAPAPTTPVEPTGAPTPPVTAPTRPAGAGAGPPH
jgi:membrane peptidoglycan carboxypeptidase